MRILGKILIGLIVLVVLLVAGAGALLATFNPNSYKGQIAALVQDKTGRPLSFGGNIKIVFYPILGFEVNNVSLGNPAGFSEKNFLQVGQMQVGVKLIPLLHKQIQLTTLRLQAPVISLIKRKDGHTNFEPPATMTTAKPPVKAIAAPGTEKAVTAEQLAALQIEKLEISDASLSYADQQTGKTVTVTPFNLKLGNFQFGHDAPLAIDFILHNGAPPQTVSVKMSGKVNADPAAGKYQVAQLHTTVNLKPAQGAALDFSVDGNAVVDQKAQTIAATDLHVKGVGMDVTGTANMKNFSAPTVDFTLNAPSIDLVALQKTEATPVTPAPVSTTQTAADQTKPLLPLAFLRTLKLDGRVTIGALKTGKLTFNNIKTTIAAHGGVMTVDPLTVDLYKGHLAATAKLDARSDAPVVTLKGQLQGLDIGELLTAQMGEDYVTGSANANFDLTSNGNTVRALQSNSGGKFGFAVGQGTINKWQLSKLINQAMAFVNSGQTAANTASDQLNFSSLSGTFTGVNGLFTNNDLRLLGPQLHTDGSGTVDLRQQQIDYTLKVGLGNDPTKYANNKSIPVRITGQLTSPRYNIDLQAAITEFAGKKIEKKADKLLSKLTGDKTGTSDTSKNVKSLLKGFLGGGQ